MPPSLSVLASRPKVKHPGESILFAVDFSKLLASGESLSSVGSLAVTPTGLTVNAPVVNASAFDNDEGGVVAVGHAAQFRLAGGVADTDYILTVTTTTTAGNVRVGVCLLQVRDA
ncbi:MAG: hypothetical protein EXS05_18090 [Planctomycetaceae bacterium]|nr:hypothetical protein [Planctomycetaceae bacterium]